MASTEFRTFLLVSIVATHASSIALWTTVKFFVFHAISLFTSVPFEYFHWNYFIRTTPQENFPRASLDFERKMWSLQQVCLISRIYSCFNFLVSIFAILTNGFSRCHLSPSGVNVDNEVHQTQCANYFRIWEKHRETPPEIRANPLVWRLVCCTFSALACLVYSILLIFFCFE